MVLWAPHVPGIRSDARLSVEAETIAVRVTRWDQTGFGPANAPKSHATRVREYATARLEAAAWDTDANWMIAPASAGGLDAATVGSSNVKIRASTEETWRSGINGVSAQEDTENPLAAERVIPAGRPWAQIQGGSSVAVSGDVWLYVWGINATITDPAGARDDFPSGEWSDNQTAAFRDDHLQFLAIRLTNATVEVRQSVGALRVSGSNLNLGGASRALLQDAQGRAQIGDRPLTFADDKLDLEGDISLAVAPNADARRLSVEPTGLVAEATLDGQAVAFAPDAVTRRARIPTPILPVFFLVTAGGVLTWSGMAWKRRRWTHALDGAEAALLQGRPDQARRRLRRILEKRPEDVNALFLYGATWLQEGAPERVVAELEPVARRLDGCDRRALAFLLALAHARMRRAEPALEWLAAAIAEPLFRDRAGREPDFVFLRGEPRFRLLVETGPPLYA